MLADDFTFAEFLEFMEVYEFRTLPYPEPARFLDFHHAVLEAASRGLVTWDALAVVAGLPSRTGAFWVVVDWLGSHGLPTDGDGEGVYLHPVGDSFLRGYRLYGHDPERWDELLNRFVAEGIPDE